jgi:phage terminase large subunit-like protein
MSAVSAVLDRLSPAARVVLAQRLGAARRQRDAGRRFDLAYPDTGPLRRALYPGHVSFFEAGRDYLERAILGGNRTGKSTAVAFELVCHLCGRYPPWWRGRRFDRPIAAWAVGDDAKSVREAAQAAMLGDIGAWGSGMLPADTIVSTTRRPGVPDSIDTVFVRHVSGGRSRLTFKSYDMRREAFQGAKIDACWMDEEPPGSLYSEAIMRLTATVPGETSGLMMCAFTPLRGLSDVVLRYLPGGKPVAGHPRFSVIVGWEDVPHMMPEEKAKLEAALAPHEREARTKGIPSIGAGAIYPVPESNIVVEPFEIPAWYRRVYGLDVGWNRTAALWLAFDYEHDIVYLYSEHYQQHAEPAVHAQGIRARGDWIPGVIDPAARGRSQHDGEQLLAIYEDLGLNLTVADNGVESGIYRVLERMTSGRLKIFNTLQNLLAEIRIYRRDEKGRVVKERDHLCDGLRYAVGGLMRAASKPYDRLADRDWPRGTRSNHQFQSEYDSLAHERFFRPGR